MDINGIIKNKIEPQADKECKKLGLPTDFVRNVHGYRGKAFEAGFVAPVFNGSSATNNVVGVDIKIREDENEGVAKEVFYSSMKTAQQYFRHGFMDVHSNPVYYGIGSSFYAMRRCFEDKLRATVAKLRHSD